MKLRDVISFTAFGLIVVTVLAYFGSLGIRVKPPTDRINVSMAVHDINGLVAGSNVLLRGVPIGKVTSISTDVHAATVDFYVESVYRIPLDSEIRLENLSALGESYIGFLPRIEGGAVLRDGQRIAVEAVTQPPSISELATSVVRVLDQLDPGALERIIAEANIALPDPVVVLPNISRASVLLRNTIAGFHGRGRAVFDNVQTLLEKSAYVAPTLTALTPVVHETAVWFQDTLKQFAVGFHRDEPSNIDNLNKLVKRLQLFLDTSGPDLKVLGEALLPKLNAISGALMNVDTGQILDNMLAAVPADGAVTLRVVP